MGQVLHLSTIPLPPQRIIFGSALVRGLIACASRNTGLAPREITGGGRSRDMVWTRWAIAMVARECGRTLPQIAECLNRDHTTIMHGLKACRAVRDPDFHDLLTLLREEAAR